MYLVHIVRYLLVITLLEEEADTTFSNQETFLLSVVENIIKLTVAFAPS